MNVVIIDYGAGNIQSLQFALKRLGVEAVLSGNANVIRAADKVLFPGVGAAGSAMDKLRVTGLDKVIPSLTQPVLGICLGMQLLCAASEEGNTQGLGVFSEKVVRFPPTVKVPQVGWNTIHSLKGPLFESIAENEFMYLVHSYYVLPCKAAVALTEYGVTYAAAIEKNNFYGVQFHPEKSAQTGAQLLDNFLKL
ncbi:imidazole glycerol phosphate synthase subunit HisH [Altibacter sp.]|uniref:imidazole glycerol phosphate synthase subunit HisH n=1 Tax=Altibacter sp. TaxID=2024823 RepID=UPI00258EFF2D|nr:imidazole glycerol phosphate synthase subunit HisH [Altibacter sp.]MCW9037776.1 imidazole glycerol phosphate synthase subunit HisH [Altibacter sp.]